MPTHAMKVMFLFQGLPHYYNYVLNRLNAVKGLTVVDVVPRNPSQLGAGVFQSHDDIEFKLYELPEHHSYKLGAHFPDLWKVIIRERPDVIVLGGCHLKSFMRSVLLRLVVAVFGTKLILKNIPFRIPSYDTVAEEKRAPVRAVLAAPSPFVARTSRILHRFTGHLVNWVRILGALHYPIRWLMIGLPVERDLRNRRRFFQFPDAHVTYTKEGPPLFAGYGVDPRKVFVTYNSPDTDRLLAVYEELLKVSPPIQKKPHRLIHVGRLVDWKRVDLLIMALKKLKHDYPDADLLVLGDGPQREEWERLAVAEGVSEAVHFVGGVYDPVVLGKHLMSSSLYVLAGMGGLSINEAMCFGLPALCSVCDGTEKELVIEGYSGRFFANGEGGDLYEKIRTMLGAPEELSCMGRNALKIVREQINIKTVVKGYVQAFQFASGIRLPGADERGGMAS